MTIILGVLLVVMMAICVFVFSAYQEARKIEKVKPIETVYQENYAKENYVHIDDISTNIKMVIIGTEDNRFFSHGGINYRKIMYAAYKNICNGRKMMGGSTITQQLAKNLYLSFDKTYRRKMIEYFLAYYIENKLGKEQIFELYLNVIDYGKEQYGIAAAGNFWFKKHPCDITVNEAVTLAALLPSPVKYNPLSDYGLFPKAKNLALKKLNECNLMEDELIDLLKQYGYCENVDNHLIRKCEKFYAEEYARRQKNTWAGRGNC